MFIERVDNACFEALFHALVTSKIKSYHEKLKQIKKKNVPLRCLVLQLLLSDEILLHLHHLLRAQLRHLFLKLS